MLERCPQSLPGGDSTIPDGCCSFNPRLCLVWESLGLKLGFLFWSVYSQRVTSNRKREKIKGVSQEETGSREGGDKGGGVALIPPLILHFGLVLQVGHVSVPFVLVFLVLLLLLRFQLGVLVQLAGNRPRQGQFCSAGHLCQLFGTVHGGVGLVGFVEAVVVDLVEAVLQREDGREAIAPEDLARDVGAAGLAGHPCSKHRRNKCCNQDPLLPQAFNLVFIPSVNAGTERGLAPHEGELGFREPFPLCVSVSEGFNDNFFIRHCSSPCVSPTHLLLGLRWRGAPSSVTWLSQNRNCPQSSSLLEPTLIP